MAMASEARALFLGHVPMNCMVEPPIGVSRRVTAVSCRMRHRSFSVFDLDDNSVPEWSRNGFTFVNADEKSLNDAMERAFKYYKQNPELWQGLVKRVMNMDFSWASSASQYEELYHKSLARARAFAQS